MAVTEWVGDSHYKTARNNPPCKRYPLALKTREGECLNMTTDTNTAIDTTDTITDEDRARFEIVRIENLELQLQEALKKVSRASDGPFHTERAWEQTPAHELWAKATKQERHEQRLDATLAAARLAASKWGIPLSPITALRDPHAGVLLALLVDAIGVGGYLGLSGAGTYRPSEFSRLGKGRKQASDYPCWAYAAQLAWGIMNPTGGRIDIQIDPDEGVILDVEGVGEAVLPAHPDLVPLLGQVLLHLLGNWGDVGNPEGGIPPIHISQALVDGREAIAVVEAAYNAAVRAVPTAPTAPVSTGDDW